MKIRVSEIRVKRIRVNQGLGVHFFVTFKKKEEMKEEKRRVDLVINVHNL